MYYTDGCLIAYRSKLTLHSYENIFFNDLSKIQYHNSVNSLHFVDQNFVRQNVAILAKFSFKTSPEKIFILTVGHLFWNPEKPEIKLLQTAYWLEKMKNFSLMEACNSQMNSSTPQFYPIIMTGDLNSTPDSEPYKLITESKYFDSNYNVLIQSYKKIRQTDGIAGDQTKFVCDSSLRHFAKWLRILGIDVKTSEEKPYDNFFNQAKKDKRVILTTSRGMRLRSNCPRSSFISTDDLELSLVNLYREYDLTRCSSKILSLCSKCGGNIVIVDRHDERVVNYVPIDKVVYLCLECNQGYWKEDSDNSSYSRTMKLARRLDELLEANGILKQPLETDAPSGLPAEAFEMEALKADTLLIGQPDRPDRLRSVFYPTEPELTNWNKGFMATLDYIFVSQRISVLAARVYPSVLPSPSSTAAPLIVNTSTDHQQEIILEGTPARISASASTSSTVPLWPPLLSAPPPTADWPSDHFMLHCELSVE